jgi:hypothetical protein
MTTPSFVIPAKAGIQLYRSKLDPDFRQGDERGMFPLPLLFHVMAGLDPAISGQRQMRGSSPRMTHLIVDNIPSME